MRCVTRSSDDVSSPTTTRPSSRLGAASAHDARQTISENPAPRRESAAESQRLPNWTSRPSTHARSNGSAAPGDLAIPAYDTLSCVPGREASGRPLDARSCSRSESHERSNRHRATILNRVEQLLSGEPSLESP